MVNKMWHIAIEEGTTRLQDVVVASVPIEDLALLRVLLSTQHLKGMPVETERGNYLLMYDGDSGACMEILADAGGNGCGVCAAERVCGDGKTAVMDTSG